MKTTLTYLIIAVLTAFAGLTLFLSSSIIFDWFGIRAKEGNYVMFVVWTNFICGLLYLVAAYGFLKLKKWTYQILGVAIVLLIAALIGFFIHINNGGLYETKTVGALFFRISVTLVFTLFAYLRIKKRNN